MLQTIRMSPTALRTSVDSEPSPPFQGWLPGHALTLIAGACVAAATRQGVFLAVPALASFAVLWRYRPRPASTRAFVAGIANGLTASRIVAVLLATAAMPGGETGWVLAAFTFNVAIDALDGPVARRWGHASSFGVVLDREADAAFVLAAYLYFHIYSIGGLGEWVLLAGLLPYLYRLSVALWSVPVAPDEREPRAAPLAAINFILLLCGVGLPAHAGPILTLSVSIVFLSFGTSFLRLIRHGYSFSQ